MCQAIQTATLIEGLPLPETVRQRLGENLREADLLRSLLKLSQRAEQEKQRRHQEVATA